jgi:ribosomal protein S18 acetylase RimI-like enzyme
MVVIRDVAAAEVPAVRALLVETWHATYDRIYGPAKVTEITDSWHSLPALSREVGAPRASFLLAERDGRTLATSFAHLQDDGCVLLRRLYVAPAAQAQGIGQALLERTLSRFPDARCARLEVEPENEGAIRFYERNGFRSVQAAGSCCGRADLAAVTMEKALIPAREGRADSPTGPAEGRPDDRLSERGGAAAPTT